MYLFFCLILIDLRILLDSEWYTKKLTKKFNGTFQIFNIFM